MREEGRYDDEMLELAKQGTLAGIAATIRTLPPFDWVDGQVRWTGWGAGIVVCVVGWEGGSRWVARWTVR
jgi:hypothetical protein